MIMQETELQLQLKIFLSNGKTLRNPCCPTRTHILAFDLSAFWYTLICWYLIYFWFVGTITYSHTITHVSKMLYAGPSWRGGLILCLSVRCVARIVSKSFFSCLQIICNSSFGGWVEVEDTGLTDDELSHGIIDQLAIQNLTTAKGAVL